MLEAEVNCIMSRKSNISERTGRPERIGRIVTRIMARHGFHRRISSEQLEQVWREAVGEMVAERTRLGSLRRGVLEVFISHPLIGQELSFRQTELTEALNQVSKDFKIKRLKLRQANF